MKLIKLISVLALVVSAGTAQASIIMPDLRVKEPVGNFNPQPDPPGKAIEAQVDEFNPQPDPPGKNIIVQ